MITQAIDGVSFHMKEEYDFSFLSRYGKVFKVFDKSSSGTICFGVEKSGKRYFLKFAGAKTINDALQNVEDTIMRLKFSVPKYNELKHPLLINQIDADEAGGGFITVFDWFDGESCGYLSLKCMRNLWRSRIKKNNVYMRVFWSSMPMLPNVAMWQ